MKHKTELLDLIKRWCSEIDAIENKHSKLLYRNSKKACRVGGRAQKTFAKLFNKGYV